MGELLARCEGFFSGWPPFALSISPSICPAQSRQKRTSVWRHLPPCGNRLPYKTGVFAIPIIAVAAAIGAAAVAGSAVAAVGITAVTALEIVAAVGATVAAVGAVTGNKTLTMVGGAIGMVGAIGGLAAGAGSFGSEAASGGSLFGAAPAASTADVAGPASAAGAGAINGGAFGAAADVSGPASAAGAGAVGMSAADAASAGTIPFIADGMQPGQSDLTTLSTTSDTVANPTNSAAANAVNPMTGGGLDSTGMPNGLVTQPLTASGTPTPATPGLSGPGNSAAAGATGNADGLDVPANSAAAGATGDATASSGTAGTSADAASSGSVFDKILAFTKQNPTLTSGVLTVGGKFLEGAFSTLTPADVARLNAQAAANNAAAALTNQQRTNLSMPKSVASSTPVTGTPGPLVPQVQLPGIINQAPRLASVTGAPA